MGWIIILKIMTWIPVCLNAWIIFKNCRHSQNKQRKKRTEIVVWSVALAVSLFNAVWVSFIAKW